MSFLRRDPDPEKLGVKFGHPGETWSRAAAARIERSQLRCFGHLLRIPPGRLPVDVFRACVSNCEETPGQTQNTLEGLYLYKDIWASFRISDGWMDG